MSPIEPRQISFRIDWRDALNGVECNTLASITLLIDGTPAWPVSGEDTDEFEWFADELLSHLTECWKPLILRQTYPIAVQPERPSFLMADAAKRWASLPEALVESEKAEVSAFEDVHNMANAFGGITGLLPLWFLRDQDRMIIDTQERLWQIPLKAAIDALTAVGDAIAERLLKSKNSKWEKLLIAWKNRDQGDPTLLLALTIGRDRATATTLLNERVLEAPTSLADATNDSDELRIAARMAGPLPINQIRKVIDTVRSCHHFSAPRLTASSAVAIDFLNSETLQSVRSHVQGVELAKWFRKYLNLSSTRMVDPFSVLKSQGIDCRIIDFGFATLYAIAVWGAKHGPAVLLNGDQTRIASLFTSIWQRGAIRVNAAHELCHLLVDSRHGFSAVDVLGGRMPPRIEQRAKAFAAEFLLPNSEAGEIWRAAGSPIEIDAVRQVLRTLCTTYKVTESVASWQLEHGVSPYHQEALTHVLDQIVPHR
jgi:Zn-dependent peptidase ImmA (M78 family)